MTTADEWVQQGLGDVGQSRQADTSSDYRGDLARAVACFDQALALEPTHAAALRAKGQALAALGDDEGALDAFVAASQGAPDDAELQLAAAQALQRSGRPEAALLGFEKVLHLRADDAEARFRRAELLTTLGRDELAVAAWDEVLRAGSTRAVTLAGGQTVRVVTADLRRQQALLSRALALNRLGRPDARTEFLEAYRAIGAELGRLGTPAVFLEVLRSSPLAREAWRAHLDEATSDAHGWHRAADTFAAAGLLDDALAAWAVVLARSPTNSRAWFGRAELRARRGELALAVADYERSLALQPDFLGAQARLALVRAQLEAGPRDG